MHGTQKLVFCAKVASIDTVTGSQSNREPLGCGGKGDLNPQYAVNQSKRISE